MNARLDAHTERRVAVAAGVDPRTVRAYLSGRRIRSVAIRERIAEALRSVLATTDSAAPEHVATILPRAMQAVAGHSAEGDGAE